MQTKKKIGFTLIELLVVIVIIGVLASLAMIALSSVRGKARDAKRVTDVRAIVSALDLYFANEGTYPSLVTPGQQLAGPSGTVYLAKVPTNPHPEDGSCAAGTEYSYTQTGSGTGYLLSYCLGNATGNSNVSTNCAAPGNLSATPGSTGAYPGNTGATTQPESSPCICGDCSTLSCDGLSDFASSAASCSVGSVTYYAVKEGTQCWLDKNLNFGSRVAGATDMTDDTTIQKWCPSDVEGNCTARGALYTWAEAMYLPNSCNSSSGSSCAPAAYVSGSGVSAKRQGLCPKGWHVPSDYDFEVLENYLDSGIAAPVGPSACSTNNHGYYADLSACTLTLSGDTNFRGTASGGISDQLKPAATCFSGVNCGRSGLNMYLAGYRTTPGVFTSLTSNSMFWTANQYNSTYAYMRNISDGAYGAGAKAERNGNNMTKSAYGFFVRCIKD